MEIDGEEKMEDESELMPAWDLWEADPNCDHNVIDAPGGGVKCTKCSGWKCY